MPKHIFVTGGVISGIGKGITAASLGRLLKARGYKVAAQKMDPYMNANPGTISPFQHGEVFVTDDGIETDLDLGHYERFIDENLNKYSSISSGRIYQNVLDKERDGEYLGETIQVIPHVTNEIKSFIYNVGAKTNADIVITEIGGTIGDIEGLPFIEAIRQVSLEVGPENCCFVHVTLVPYIKSSGEHKTKPTQHSVKELQSLGINPNIIVLRADEMIDDSILKKVALFCNVHPDCVIRNTTVPILYEAPIEMEKNHISEIVLRELGLPIREADLSEWENMLNSLHTCTKSIRIGLVGKYVKLHDAYLSIAESLKHAGIANGANVEIKWIDSETVNDATAASILGECDGLLTSGFFGERAIEGMVSTAKYARENNIPFFGICTGMHAAVIDYLRNVCGQPDANSAEFNKDVSVPCFYLMPGKDGSLSEDNMRLGSYPCMIKSGTRMADAYQSNLIEERHRHHYEFNKDCSQLLEDNGMIISGVSPDGCLVESIELPDHPFFVGVQFRPEFKSRPTRPHPLFRDFVKASLK